MNSRCAWEYRKQQTITMPIDAQSLILNLKHTPTQLFLGRSALPNKSVRLGNQRTTLPSFPPWSVCPDVLVNSESRDFIGITYPIDGENRDLVSRLSSTVSQESLRYNDLTVE